MEIAVIKLIEVPNGAICKRPDIGSGKPVVDSGYCTYCVRTFLSDWEASEEWQVTDIQNAITSIKDLALFDHDPTIKELGENLDNAMAQTIDEIYQEFEEQARNTKQWRGTTFGRMIEAEQNRLEREQRGNKPKYEEFARCKLFDMNLELDKGVPLKCSDCLSSSITSSAHITQNLKVVDI